MQYIKCIALAVAIFTDCKSFRKLREFNEENFRQELFKVSVSQVCSTWLYSAPQKCALGYSQPLFQNLCGIEPHPVRFRAKKYKINIKQIFSLEDFQHMMTHLPENKFQTRWRRGRGRGRIQRAPTLILLLFQDIMEMFTFADKERDWKILYDEFLIMITPVKVSIRSNSFIQCCYSELNSTIYIYTEFKRCQICILLA